MQAPPHCLKLPSLHLSLTVTRLSEKRPAVRIADSYLYFWHDRFGHVTTIVKLRFNGP